jgi:tRNA 2-thiouridine synthesizing protein A
MTGRPPLPDDQTAARTIDTRGLACPLPVLKARKVLLSLAPGERLVVMATDPLAAVDIPHFCQEDGHRLVANSQRAGVLTFVIERGSEAGNDEP